jgi:hypothetical protein
VSGRLVLLVAMAAAGCQDREVVGSIVPVKSVPVTAASGAFITVTAEEDPVLAGVWLNIPPGSLPRDLTVTIERGGQDIASTTTLPAGPVVIVGPVGTQPSSRTTILGLPLQQGTMSQRAFVEVREADGRRLTVNSLKGPDAPDAESYVFRFAAFQAARLRPGAAEPDGGVPPPPVPPRDAR